MSMSMHLSNSEIFTAIIFIVSVCKTIWDLWLTDWIFNSQSKDVSGPELTNEVGAKKKRDSISASLSFLAISIFTALIIGGGTVTKELTREEFESLDNRVKTLESYFTPPGGGAPTKFSTLMDSIDGRISNLEQTMAANEDLKKLREDFDKYKRIRGEQENRIGNDQDQQLQQGG